MCFGTFTGESTRCAIYPALLFLFCDKVELAYGLERVCNIGSLELLDIEFIISLWTILWKAIVSCLTCGMSGFVPFDLRVEFIEGAIGYTSNRKIRSFSTSSFFS